ncbi:MAG: hypothetical protein JW910_02260, partial [Anaerolineae bacterium]|nr:hypothetical protein [Anaerolineae bacterium]
RSLWDSTPFPVEFVDAFWQEQGQVTPLMLSEVSAGEVERLVTYWRRAAEARPAGIDTGEQADPFTTDEPLAGTAEESPALPSVAALLRAAKALMPRGTRITQARSLAGYLGWLGIDPLRDVFGLSRDEAERIIGRLREEGFLKPGDGRTWRIAREEPDDQSE